MKEMMTITINTPKHYGLFGHFGIIADLTDALKDAVEAHRKTNKPVSKEFRECIRIEIVGYISKAEDSRRTLKKRLLKLSEPQLTAFFRINAVKMPTNDDYFALTDLLKEVCQANGYEIDNVLNYDDTE